MSVILKLNLLIISLPFELYHRLGLFLFSLLGLPIFHLGHMIIYLATWLQSCLMLYLLYWKWNRFDLSLDAVIKLFTCGFILTASVVMFVEVVEGYSLLLVFKIIMSLSNIEVVTNNDGYSMTQSHGRLLSISKWESFKSSFQQDYPFIVVIYLFFNAYFVAGLVEEICKYFGFRMLNHPDFMSEDRLEKVSQAFALTTAQERTNKPDYDSSDSEQDDCDKMDRKIAEDRAPSSNDGVDKNDCEITGDRAPSSNEPATFQVTDARSCTSIGAGITVAMTAVALGFACCENLLYIFVYNENKNPSMGKCNY